MSRVKDEMPMGITYYFQGASDHMRPFSMPAIFQTIKEIGLQFFSSAQSPDLGKRTTTEKLPRSRKHLRDQNLIADTGYLCLGCSWMVSFEAVPLFLQASCTTQSSGIESDSWLRVAVSIGPAEYSD
ncbi:hypothetical protein VTP01DRAFT_2517 [Rhizomucor pusillus]|uniref:uncharacterized protein n=1 Tax=Rhizomucor pusillus TaxID=4840 RepID=UPI003742127A